MLIFFSFAKFCTNFLKRYIPRCAILDSLTIRDRQRKRKMLPPKKVLTVSSYDLWWINIFEELSRLVGVYHISKYKISLKPFFFSNWRTVYWQIYFWRRSCLLTQKLWRAKKGIWLLRTFVTVKNRLLNQLNITIIRTINISTYYPSALRNR